MFKIIAEWFQRYFSDVEAVSLSIGIILTIIIFTVMGNVLVPIIASMIIAYMLIGCVKRLEQWKIPHLPAVILAYLLFISMFLILFVWLLPLLIHQLANLFTEIPRMLNHGQTFFAGLQKQHPEYFSADFLKHVISELSQYLTKFGRFVLGFSITSIGSVITFIVYLVLVPLLVFFFLKDSSLICHWLKRFLPKKRQTMQRIWHELDHKIGDYIRGKLIEIIIIALISVVAFALLGLDYAVLLAVAVGLSVIIPYVGAIVVTIPIVVIAFLQWGWSTHFIYVVLTFFVIQIFDGNLLAPVLFSEKMQIHPVAIILAVMVFGALWGFWGIFFAIPLATLINILLREWPVKIEKE